MRWLELTRLKSDIHPYFFLILWVLLILILYFSINWKNITYCIEVYKILLRYPKTLLLLVLPSLVISLIAAMRFIKSHVLRKSQ